jgi:hypothetical protein
MNLPSVTGDCSIILTPIQNKLSRVLSEVVPTDYNITPALSEDFKGFPGYKEIFACIS